MSAPASVTAGEAFYITVTARTSDNLIVENYDGTVHFETSATVYDLPGDYTYTAATDNGSHIFEVKLMTAGSQSVTVNDTVQTSVTGSANITVEPANVISFTVGAPSTVYAGDNFPVTVTAKDTYNNIVTDYTGTITFSSSDPNLVSGDLPSDYSFQLSDQGRNVFSASLKTVGLQTITVEDLSASTINGTSNGISVLAGPLYEFEVDASGRVALAVSITARIIDVESGHILFAMSAGQHGNNLPAVLNDITYAFTDALEEERVYVWE